MKDVKIVIGANYGDEGKGLMTRHFVVKANTNPIVIFHNGTAQRGHTVDYSNEKRHVYHHFCSGTADGAPTFFAKSFLVHPMEYYREYCELTRQGIVPPKSFCDPNALVITPFDMMVDHATEEHIAKINGQREYGSCGLGSWCAAEDRLPQGRTAYTISDFKDPFIASYLLEEVWKDCLGVCAKRGVDLEKSSFKKLLADRSIVIRNFLHDIQFFINHCEFISFDNLWKANDSFIFENGQGLGLDMDVPNDWHTTSHTGLVNPVEMLKDKHDFSAEVCYVTRAYLTRHGVGPLEEAVKKSEINADMHDKTNVHNEFQGSLRYGFIENDDQAARIIKDYNLVRDDNRFKYNMAITHCNEFETPKQISKYYSDNPFEVKENN